MTTSPRIVCKLNTQTFAAEPLSIIRAAHDKRYIFEIIIQAAEVALMQNFKVSTRIIVVTDTIIVDDVDHISA